MVLVVAVVVAVVVVTAVGAVAAENAAIATDARAPAGWPATEKRRLVFGRVAVFLWIGEAQGLHRSGVRQRVAHTERACR